MRNDQQMLDWSAPAQEFADSLHELYDSAPHLVQAAVRYELKAADACASRAS